jgi:hypothetical protein
MKRIYVKPFVEVLDCDLEVDVLLPASETGTTGEVLAPRRHDVRSFDEDDWEDDD